MCIFLCVFSFTLKTESGGDDLPMIMYLSQMSPSFLSRKEEETQEAPGAEPSSYFMVVKCPGCYTITTVFSHAQTVVLSVGCSTVLCQPTGGKARFTEKKDAPSTEAALKVPCIKVNQKPSPYTYFGLKRHRKLRESNIVLMVDIERQEKQTLENWLWILLSWV